jgi:putative flavoprotein involved in K+ transport
VEHRAIKDRITRQAARAATSDHLGKTEQPYCLIVGGSQGGLALGARMKRLGVPTLIVDVLPKPGDAWRKRYRTLCLHDPVWIDHMPYVPFPDHWPVYTPKDKMGDWLEAYGKIMELDFWGSSTCLGASWDEGDRRWRVTIARPEGTVEVRPAQLVLATGLSGVPKRPELPGAERFEGVQLHSADYEDGAACAGKRCGRPATTSTWAGRT